MRIKGSKNTISKKIEFICRECGNIWKDYPSRLGKKKYCSKHCAALNKPQLYKKGNKINLGRKYTNETKNKISQANKIAWSNPSIRRKLSLERRRNNNPNWSGNNIKYSGIHKWLVREYGNANICEGTNCSKKYITYQWAKIKERKYERKRDNFMMLCISCHSKYDKQK